MKKIAPLPETTEEEPPFKPLTAQEAHRLREQNPPVSPWWVVAGQAAVGLVVALAAWAHHRETKRRMVCRLWRAGRGDSRGPVCAGPDRPFFLLNAGTAAVGFMVWEMVKIASSIALLMAAPRLVVALSWPALLVGLVLTMKVYWVALAFAPRTRRTADDKT